MLRIYPIYKEVAHLIANNQQVFYTDVELASLLEVEPDLPDFQFLKMNLIYHLLDKYKIDFIRAINEKFIKGYKIATPEESVKLSAKRLQNRIVRAARKQRKVLGVVSREKLPEEIKLEYDAYLIRGGLFASFLAQTPLRRCLEGVVMRIDRPKLIKK